MLAPATAQTLGVRVAVSGIAAPPTMPLIDAETPFSGRRPGAVRRGLRVVGRCGADLSQRLQQEGRTKKDRALHPVNCSVGSGQGRIQPCASCYIADARLKRYPEQDTRDMVSILNHWTEKGFSQKPGKARVLQCSGAVR